MIAISSYFRGLSRATRGIVFGWITAGFSDAGSGGGRRRWFLSGVGGNFDGHGNVVNGVGCLESFNLLSMTPHFPHL